VRESALTWPDGSIEKLAPLEVEDWAEANRYITELMVAAPGANFTVE
jgi:hypothetical protein